jgi:hypothetical protein
MTENNPYKPPDSKVSDAPEGGPIERPQSVTVALWVLWIGLGVDVAFVLSRLGGDLDAHTPASGLIGQMIGFAIASSLFVMIGQGRNWARITYLVLTCVGLAIVAFVYQQLMSESPLIRIAAFGRPLANAVAMYLVFIPGRDWFRPR